MRWLLWGLCKCEIIQSASGAGPARQDDEGPVKYCAPSSAVECRCAECNRPFMHPLVPLTPRLLTGVQQIISSLSSRVKLVTASNGRIFRRYASVIWVKRDTRPSVKAVWPPRAVCSGVPLLVRQTLEFKLTSRRLMGADCLKYNGGFDTQR